MPSGLILRYAQVSGKPIAEVEKRWRAIKQEFSANGRKREYDSAIRKLRENLGLKKEQGRKAYLQGQASVLILAETPEYALVQVEDLDLVESADLQYLLFTSNSIMSAPWNLLAHKKGGPMLVEVVDTSNLGAGTVAPQIQTARPATTARPAAAPQVQSKATDKLNGLVNFRGRKAVVVKTTDATHSHIRFLDTNEEQDVVTTELQPDPSAVESIWRSIDKTINEKAKYRVFEAIIKLEYGIDYLPAGLREDVHDLATGVEEIPGTQLKNVEEPEELNREDAAKRKDFQFEPDDWDIIFSLKDEDEGEEKEAAEDNPFPEPPEEKGEREEGPAAKNIPPASDEEVHGMLKHIKAARESIQDGNTHASWSERKRINLSEMRAAVEKGPAAAPKSVMEKNLERAHQWEGFFSD